jgi:hypothetical protein
VADVDLHADVCRQLGITADNALGIELARNVVILLQAGEPASAKAAVELLRELPKPAQSPLIAGEPDERLGRLTTAEVADFEFLTERILGLRDHPDDSVTRLTSRGERDWLLQLRTEHEAMISQLARDRDELQWEAEGLWARVAQLEPKQQAASAVPAPAPPPELPSNVRMLSR